MKIIYPLIFTLLLSIAANGQDRIITLNGDTVVCKITRETKGKVYFTFFHENELRNTFLFRDQIKKYSKGTTPKIVYPEGYEEMIQPAVDDPPHLWVGLGIGMDYVGRGTQVEFKWGRSPFSLFVGT